jgi:hypothetical protein
MTQSLSTEDLIRIRITGLGYLNYQLLHSRNLAILLITGDQCQSNANSQILAFTPLWSHPQLSPCNHVQSSPVQLSRLEVVVALSLAIRSGSC